LFCGSGATLAPGSTHDFSIFVEGPHEYMVQMTKSDKSRFFIVV